MFLVAFGGRRQLCNVFRGAKLGYFTPAYFLLPGSNLPDGSTPYGLPNTEQNPKPIHPFKLLSQKELNGFTGIVGIVLSFSFYLDNNTHGPDIDLKNRRRK